YRRLSCYGILCLPTTPCSASHFEVVQYLLSNYTVEDLPLQNVPFRAHPFTGFSSCPKGCSFASVGDQLYLVGGYRHSTHVISTIRGNPKKAEGLKYPLDDISSRVLRFDCQQFVNSLGENKGKEKMKFSELNDEVVHENWETCAPLSIPRRKASLLHLDGKLWAVGGIFDNKGKAPLIEVFEDGVWNPLKIHYPPEIDGFYLIKETLVGLESGILLDCCHEEPGFVVRNNYAMWYDTNECCIRGLDLRSNKHFHVSLMDDVLMFEHKHEECGLNGQNAKLIDMQDEEGSLCFIYYGNMCCPSIDDRGVEYLLCEYHFVTFQIDFNDETVENISFPGVELEPRVISRRKCYAPAEWDLGAAFAMDGCLFLRKNA
ncbi:hypothetical protein Leryth_005107, partial [Lithospermum erythrorhizon]